MTKVFTEAQGYSVRDFLHFGVDHLESGRLLYNQGPAYSFDSAGYLAHLGIELLLKAWHLHQFKSFENEHGLVRLYEPLRKFLDGPSFSQDQEQLLVQLDSYYELRYPRRHDPVETGTDDWMKIDELLESLWDQMPKDLLSIRREIDPTKKGGRKLMKKKIE